MTFNDLLSKPSEQIQLTPSCLFNSMQKDQNSSVADESHLREPKLVEVELESEDDEVLDDAFATPPFHMSPSRSHSRMRMGSYRVRLRFPLICLHVCFIVDKSKSSI